MAMLKLGDKTKEFGKVVAIGITGGERYYWFKKGNIISMIPAFMVKARSSGKDK